jgi:hypothetical protein
VLFLNNTGYFEVVSITTRKGKYQHKNKTRVVICHNEKNYHQQQQQQIRLLVSLSCAEAIVTLSDVSHVIHRFFIIFETDIVIHNEKVVHTFFLGTLHCSAACLVSPHIVMMFTNLPFWYDFGTANEH